jgi:ribosomal-protein-alanine N-acetyltransferase
MFDTQNLHRIMANYIPGNERSARLLERLGFEREGYAKAYLNIAGRWQDHVMTALVNSRFETPEKRWSKPLA